MITRPTTPVPPAGARRGKSRYRAGVLAIAAVIALSLVIGTGGTAPAAYGAATTSAASAPAQHRADSAGTWTSLPPIPGGPRQEHSVVALGHDIYVIGGMVLDATVPLGASATGRVEVYHTRRGTWSTVAPVPVAMNHLNVTVAGGKIYVLGGLSGGNAWHAMPNSYVYDPKMNAWTALPQMPTGTWRGSAVMGVSGTTIYLAGGMRTLVPGPGGQHDTVSMVTSYNVATRTWATLPSLPQPRDHAGGAVVHGVLYVIGGRDQDPQNLRGTVYAMDLRIKRWSERAPMPTPRGGIASALVRGTIYTFGGEGNPAAGSDGVFAQTEAYDTVHNTWRKLAPMPVPRHGTGAAAVDGTIYVPGGGIDQGAGLVAVNQSFRPPSARHHCSD